MPIIDLQRRMVEAGRIRAGDTANGHPRKLDKWRLTSKDRTRLEAAAELWGGAVKEWQGRDGEFELYTETNELPIMLLPETEPSVYYELWTKGGCQRRCDGVTEMLSDSPCMCGEERECKPHLRFPVLLPDLRGIGSWLVQSTGWNAANEIPGAMALISRAAAKGEVMPARLRLEQRVEVKSGQTRRFAVPVIDIDVSFRDLLGATALPAGSPPAISAGSYTPLPAPVTNGVSLEEGLKVAETQTVQRTTRSSAPLPVIEEVIPFGEAPVPVEEPAEVGNSIAASTRDKPATKAQATKLNVLVGELRDTREAISTWQLWAAMAKERGVNIDEMCELLEGKDEEGTWHWAPLRDSLTRAEASQLIERLEAMEQKVPA